MEKLRGEFKDAILAVASGLNAGYSVENAFAVSLKEMEEIHGSDSMIAKEIRLILRKVRMNLTFEDALGDFAARSGLDDVKNFADVFLAARKSGGELMRIITRTAEIIGEKIRIQEEILTATASKRMEQRIMSGIPVLIVIYIEFALGDLTVKPFHIDHDAADPVAYRIQSGNKSVAVATDLGHFNQYTVDHLLDLDAVLLESNHDLRMLETGPYPYYLKRRIMGDFGHLSNENAGRLLNCILSGRLKHILLGQLLQKRK